VALNRSRGSPAGRLGLVALAGMALLAGLWGGLVRIGWALPLIEPDLVLLHGPLMLAGFLGLVIGLERAVALSPHMGLRRPQPRRRQPSSRVHYPAAAPRTRPNSRPSSSSTFTFTRTPPIRHGMPPVSDDGSAEARGGS
jgi:hypothetical protein